MGDNKEGKALRQRTSGAQGQKHEGELHLGKRGLVCPWYVGCVKLKALGASS